VVLPCRYGFFVSYLMILKHQIFDVHSLDWVDEIFILNLHCMRWFLMNLCTYKIIMSCLSYDR
jgi:hypothetical protein